MKFVKIKEVKLSLILKNEENFKLQKNWNRIKVCNGIK
jgi:hypothetical protein